MEKSGKKIFVFGMLVIVSLILTGFVSAEFWGCFEKGDKVKYCNNYKPDWTCKTSSGCVKCLSVYDEVNNCYIHGVWPKCNSIPQVCSLHGDGGVVDSEPPELTFNQEVSSVQENRRVRFDFDLDERSDVFLRDNDNPRSVKRVCRSCLQVDTLLTMKEGLNNVTLIAKDRYGNEAEFGPIVFRVDSKFPRIVSTEPRRGFADGNFAVTFVEDSPKTLKLYYEGQEKIVDLNNCFEDRRKTTCNANADLSLYNGQEINYWFSLEDIAGNTRESRRVKLSVDTQAPVLEYFNYTIIGRRVFFEFNVSETNFKEITFIDWDSRVSRERKICSRLKDGVCETTRAFNDGVHNITLYVRDAAGNSVERNFVLNI